MFRADNPIKSIKDDLLNRSLFSKELANAILSLKSDKSIVIGLYGEWGSGKTSIINMVLETIKNLSEKFNPDEKPIVIMFNPWNFADQNQLISQFFKQLSLNLRKKEYGKMIERIGELIEVYGNIFNLIPLYGHTISGMIKSTGKVLRDYGIKNQNDLNAIKEKLNKCLAEQNRKIIIVIDDIDRLSNIEIKQIFQLVKSLGDFPNTVYLLSFDKQVVNIALSDIQNIPGEKYLAKVVQVPFEVPLLNRRELEKTLFNGIDEILKDISDKEWDKVYWGNVYHSGIKYFFKTIRDINRYLNSLYFNFGLVKGEVNTIDFLAITAIQVFLPNIYYAIRENKGIFTGLFGSRYSSDNREIENAKKTIEEILDSVEAEKINKENLKDLLKVLFPKLESVFGNTSYSMDFLDTWSKECRICSPKFFNRYFHLSVPINEISQKEIDYILSNSNNSPKFTEILLELEKDKILDFLDKFENYTKERVPIENIEPIIISFMDIADILPEYPKGLFDVLDTSLRVIRIFKQLLDRIENKEERFMILEKAIINSKRSLHIICEELSLRYEELKKKTTMTEQTLDTEHLEKLKELTCIKIKNWIDSNNFFKIKNLPYVLYRWKRWCNENKVIEAIKSIIIEDSNLIKFIGSFVSTQTSYGGGDYVGAQTKVIAFKEIGDFIDMSIIVPRIQNIFTSNNFENLITEDKEIIKLFLNEAEKSDGQDLK